MALLAKGQITIIDQQDGKSSYTHIRYSNDGVNFTPASAEALAAAAELCQKEGVNLFGFNKGVLMPFGNSEYSFAPDINGVRIRIRSGFDPQGYQILVRVQNLGFERAGVYTVSFRVKSNRSLASGSLNVNICDAGEKEFVPATTEQRVVTTASVGAYYAKSEQNGFVDFEFSKGAALQAGDVIEISDLMVVRGSVASDYAPAPQDAAIGTTTGKFQGTMVSESPIASTLFSDYNWIKAEGDKGEKGDRGNDGVSITSTKMQYYLSLSKTALDGDYWKDTPPPQLEFGKYLWTRMCVTYSAGEPSYTPAVLDNAWDTKKMLSFSDDNLFLGGNVRVTNKGYPTQTYMLSKSGKQLKVGELFTIVIKATLGDADKWWGPHMDYGSIGLISLTSIGGGLYMGSGTWNAGNNENGVSFFAMPNGFVNDNTIEWAKLVRGTHTSLNYTPSQEEVMAKIEAAKSAADAALNKATETYSKVERDGVVTKDEATSLVKSQVAALKAQVEYDFARIEAQYALVRRYAVGDLANNLNSAHINYNGAKGKLISAIDNFRAPFTAKRYNSEVVDKGEKTRYDTFRNTLETLIAQAAGNQEFGGVNFFGFYKDVKTAEWVSNSKCALDPQLRGCTVELVKTPVYPASGDSAFILRLQNLGLQQSGFYSVSFDIRVKRKNDGTFTQEGNYTWLDVCDVPFKRFALSSEWVRVEASADVGAVNLAVGNMKGFLDIEVNDARHGLVVGDTIEIRNLMIERGNTPSDYSPAPEDIGRFNKLLEESLKLSAMPSGMEGGVVFGGRMVAQDENRNVRAFINGLSDGTRPAFAAGVQDFGVLPSQSTNYERYATAFWHDGSGHIGQMSFSNDGSMFVGKSYKDSRFFVEGKPMRDLVALQNETTQTATLGMETISLAFSLTEWQDYAQQYGVNSIVIPTDNGELKLNGRLEIACNPREYAPVLLPRDGFLPSYPYFASASLYLCKTDGTYSVGLGKVMAKHPNTGNRLDVDIQLRNLPSGTYRLLLDASGAYCTDISASFSMSEDGFYKSISDKALTTLNTDGLLSYLNPTKFVAIRDGQLIVRGEIDRDGLDVLLAGRVNGRNGFPMDNETAYWGAASHPQKTRRLGVGLYRITHTIGSSNYVVNITPVSNNKVIVPVVAAKSDSAIDFFLYDAKNNFARVDCDFEFSIVANK